MQEKITKDVPLEKLSVHVREGLSIESQNSVQGRMFMHNQLRWTIKISEEKIQN